MMQLMIGLTVCPKINLPSCFSLIYWYHLRKEFYMIPTILTLLASMVGVWALIKYVILIEIRIDSNTFKTLFDHFRDCSKFILNEEFTTEARHPILFYAFIFPKGLPSFMIWHSERLMQAGWHGKDYVSIITCFRWDYSKLHDFMGNGLKEVTFRTHGIPVQILLPYGTDKIGSLKQIAPEPCMQEDMYKDFENEVLDMLEGKINKTGALLYGSPGNGKTSLVKYISTKYRLPIMIFTLNPEWTNHDLLLIFSNIPKRCMVLMEDFDNYFNQRECTMGGGERNIIKFTFDIILNGLDGVYNSYEKVVFIMTVNDIEKIDMALKNRPSRFKYVRHINNPNRDIRARLLPEKWVDLCEGFNLDQLFRMKEFYNAGYDFESSIKKLDKNLDSLRISILAQKIYEDRIKNQIDGDANTDWQKAVDMIKSK